MKKQKLLYFFFLLPFLPLQAQEWKNYYDSSAIAWENKDWPKTTYYLELAAHSAQTDLGVYDPNYFTILNDLALSHVKQSAYTSALDLFEQVLTLHRDIGQYDEGYIKASFNYIDLLRSIHPEKGLSLVNALYKEFPAVSPQLNLQKGVLLEALGQMDSAIYYYTLPYEDIRKPHQYFINLIRGLRMQGKFEASINTARSYYDQLCEASTSNKLKMADVLLERGLTEMDAGEYVSAASDFTEALRIAPSNLESVRILNAESALYAQMGLFEKAIYSLEQAIDLLPDQSAELLVLSRNKATLLTQIEDYQNAWLICENQLSVTLRPRDRLQVLLQAAQIKEGIGEFDQAEKYISEATALTVTNKLGKKLESDLSVQSGFLALRRGAFQQAIDNLSAGLQYKTEIHGPYSEKLSSLQSALGLAYLGSGERIKALNLLSENVRGLESRIQLIFPALNRHDKIRLYSELQKDFNRFNSLIMAYAGDDPELIKLLFHKQLLLKGLMSRTNPQFIRQTCSSDKIDSLNQSLQEMRHQLIRIYHGDEAVSADQTMLVKKIEETQDQLKQACPDHPSIYSLEGVDQQILQKALEPDEALVEIIRVKEFKTELTDQFRIGFTDNYFYIALILRPDVPLKAVRIQQPSLMDNAYFSFYRNSLEFNMTDTLSYGRYWADIKTELGDVKRVFVSNDGVYHKLNLNSLFDPSSGSYLIQQYDIHLIKNPSDILKKQTPNNSPGRALLIGSAPATSIKTKSGLHRFGSLPGAKKELMEIKEKLQEQAFTVSAYQDKEATSDKLNGASPDIVHLALHGFYNTNLAEETDFALDRGLVSSGLVFSKKDGNEILTAYEIQDMDFSQTTLVVLSACESGRGDIIEGEGLDGLQRAFINGGAKQVVLSLWRINDTSTKILMNYFYDEYLKNRNAHEALRQAELKMIETGFKPNDWSPFIVVEN